MKNREEKLVKNKEVRDANPDKHRARVATWRKSNMGYVLAYNAFRHAEKLKRTPLWLTENEKDQIKAIYAEARRLTKTTGMPHHVDHILPLQGELVSGLHVPNNLQILTETENCSKNNKYKPE